MDSSNSMFNKHVFDQGFNSNTRFLNRDEKVLMYIKEGFQYFSNRPISSEAYVILLEVYENNQSKLLEGCRNHTQLSQTSLNMLRQLEKDFITVVEPPPNRNGTKPEDDEWDDYEEEIFEWLEREKTKLSGRTYYCDSILSSIVTVDSQTHIQVEANYRHICTYYKWIFDKRGIKIDI